MIGAVFGVLISFMAGESYMMSSRPAWDTLLLPLGYMLTAMPGGVACYLVVVAAKAKDAQVGEVREGTARRRRACGDRCRGVRRGCRPG